MATKDFKSFRRLRLNYVERIKVVPGQPEVALLDENSMEQLDSLLNDWKGLPTYVKHSKSQIISKAYVQWGARRAQSTMCSSSRLLEGPKALKANNQLREIDKSDLESGFSNWSQAHN